MYNIRPFLFRAALLGLVVSVMTVSGLAADIDVTAFAGIHRQGKLTLRSAPSTAENLFRTINSTTFGAFGLRIGHGRVFGGEHSIAYSSSFIDSDTTAFIYNSNLLAQVPLPKVKPYATAGLGLIRTSGNSLGVFGTKFAINYGGGIKFLPAGPVGLRADVRGYSVPSVEFRVFTTEKQRVDFLEASIGVLFSFGK